MMDDQVLPAKTLPAALRTRDRGWTLASAQILLVAAALVLFWPTTYSLLLKWQPSDSTTYGHGYLIVAISFWLLLRTRHRLQATDSRRSLPAAILLLPISLLWLVMLRTGIQTAHQLLLPILLWLGLCAALGFQVASKSAFAVTYLFFALPIWDAANGMLQSATTIAAETLLTLTHVNAYVEGNVVHLAAGVFEIAGGCSGMHFFIVALALAALYGEVSDDTLKVRVQLLALAASLALLANWIRVYAIIVAGYLTDMQHYLVRVEHYRFGWVVFAIMMTLFFLIARRLPATQTRIAEKGKDNQDCADETLRVAVMRGLLTALVALGLGPAWNLFAPLKAAASPPQSALLPRNPGTWLGPDPVADVGWKPLFVGADLSDFGDYVDGGRRISAYTALYLSQVQGRELVGYLNSVGGAGVAVAPEACIASRVACAEIKIETGRGLSIVRYSYQVGEVATHRGIVAQLSYGLQSLLHAPISRIVAARAACIPDCESARSALDDFMSAIDVARPAFSTDLTGSRS